MIAKAANRRLDMERDSRNPIIPEERFVIETPFADLSVPGTYYIRSVSVYPSAITS